MDSVITEKGNKMSEAVICDRCRRAVAKQNAFHIDARNINLQFGSYIPWQYDLCPECQSDFQKVFMCKSIRPIDEIFETTIKTEE